MEIKEMEDFFFKNRGYIDRVMAFYNLEYDEIKNECFLAFLSSPEIEQYLLQGEHNKASTVFLTNLRRQSSKFSPSGVPVRNTESFARLDNIIDTLKYQCEDEAMSTSYEDYSLSKVVIEQLQHVKGYQFIMDLYTFGYDFCMNKYNIPRNTVKSRRKRIIKRMRKELGL